MIANKEMIKDAPAVTFTPKKSKHMQWIDNFNGTISCSCCHTWFHNDDRYPYMHYCPNCGARMDEDERTLKYADQDTMMPAT